MGFHQETYLHSRLGSVAIGCSAFFATLVAFAVYNIFVPFNLAATNWEERVIHAKHHHQRYPNGTYYYDWINPETHEEEHKLLLERWFFEIKAGRMIYNFGGNYINYCTNRTIPSDEQYPSVFKSTQLKALVQVPIRIAILLAMGIRIMLLVFTLNHKNKGILGNFLVAVEFLHQLSLFEYFNYLFTPDEKYAYIIPYNILTLHITLVIKLMGSCVFTDYIPEIVFRVVLAMVNTVTYITVNNIVTQYIRNQYCDEFVTLPECLIEFSFIVTLISSAALDLREAKNFEIFSGPENEKLCVDS